MSNLLSTSSGNSSEEAIIQDMIMRTVKQSQPKSVGTTSLQKFKRIKKEQTLNQTSTVTLTLLMDLCQRTKDFDSSSPMDPELFSDKVEQVQWE